MRSSTVPTPGLKLTRHQLDTVHIHPDSISRTLRKAALPAKMRIAGIRREEELPVYERLGDVRSRAAAMVRIADILVSRGDLDEALRIRREEQLPVFERLGEVRARAVNMGQIADILYRRGDLGTSANSPADGRS